MLENSEAIIAQFQTLTDIIKIRLGINLLYLTENIITDGKQ
jgi:hypothetical protein